MKTAFLFLSAIVLTASACDNNVLSQNKGGGNFKHFIGELFGGGVVAAVWKIKGVEHGIIVSVNDLSEAQMWSNADTVLIGPTAESATNGQANTTAIVGQAGATSTAAGLCDAYSKGGFSDWYLPSTWEMNQIYNVALQINLVLEQDDDSTTKGFECINNPYYWTSTEYFNAKSWLQNFLIGSTYNDVKKAGYRVRAVRRF